MTNKAGSKNGLITALAEQAKVAACEAIEENIEGAADAYTNFLLEYTSDKGKPTFPVTVKLTLSPEGGGIAVVPECTFSLGKKKWVGIRHVAISKDDELPCEKCGKHFEDCECGNTATNPIPKERQIAPPPPTQEEVRKAVPAAEIDEDMITQAITIIRETGKAAVAAFQRRLRVGHTKAARIMDILEERGVVGPPKDKVAREILIDLDPPQAARATPAPEPEVVEPDAVEQPEDPVQEPEEEPIEPEEVVDNTPLDETALERSMPSPGEGHSGVICKLCGNDMASDACQCSPEDISAAGVEEFLNG